MSTSPSVVIVRFPQPDFPEELPFEGDQFFSDARAVLQLSGPELEALERGLLAEPGFLERDAFFALVEKQVGTERAQPVGRFVRALDRYFRQSGLPIEEFLKGALTVLQEKSSKHLDEGEVRELTERFKRLVCAPPSLGRQWKADKLATSTGRPLEDIQIVCDIRPVFNATRDAIEGMLPVTIVKIVSTGAGGLPDVLELRVTEEQIDDLAKKAAFAQSKIARIREVLASKGITVPHTSFDRRTEK